MKIIVKTRPTEPKALCPLLYQLTIKQQTLNSFTKSIMWSSKIQSTWVQDMDACQQHPWDCFPLPWFWSAPFSPHICHLFSTSKHLSTYIFVMFITITITIIGEHLGWYGGLATALMERGLLVVGHDHQVINMISFSQKSSSPISFSLSSSPMIRTFKW